MEQHPIENIMKTTMENIKDMIDVNTIVGDPVETSDGTVIIPVSKVTFGFVSGGAEYEMGMETEQPKPPEPKASSDLPSAAASGAGVSVNPIAFLVVGEDKVRLLPISGKNSVNRILDLVPQVIDEIQGFISKDEPEKKNKKSIEDTMVN